MTENASFKIVMLIRELYSKVNGKLSDSMSTYHLTHQQMIVIKLLAHHQELTVNDFCKEMSLSKGTVSGILSRLEKLNMIAKRHDENDKRITWISFTEHGLAAAKSIRQAMNQSFESLFNDVSELEKQLIIENLKHVLALMPEEEK